MERASNGGRPVLAGVDQEPGWEAVVRFAADEATRRGVPLRLLHSVGWPLPPGSDEVATPEERAAQVVGPAARLARAEFPRARAEEVPASGRPATILVDRSHEAELLVVGHRSRGGLARLPLGSVGLEVALHAGCPVVVVRPEAGRPFAPPERVVVGIERSGTSEAAVDFAFAEAQLRGIPLELVHAAARPHVLVRRGRPASGDRTADADARRRALRQAAAARRARYPRVQVELRVEHRRPAPALLASAGRDALVVVGSDGRSGLRRLLRGSVSGEVLHVARCPVAVVPGVRPG